MTEEKRINLTFRRKDFEEIYNLKKNGSIIRNHHTRIYVWMWIVLATAFLISLSYSIRENRYVTTSLMLFIVLILYAVILYFSVKPILKWRKALLNLIKANEKYKTNTLILSDNCMELVQDETRILEKWSTISSIKIEPDYLMIAGSTWFVMPKKAMTDEEFEYLNEFVVNKIK